jgi:hypothetical protein
MLQHEATRLTLASRIQGKTVTVIVGQHSSSRTYTLPVALLCVHSLCFRNTIARLNAKDIEKQSTSKKRRLSPSEDDEASDAKCEVEVKEKTEKTTEVESTREEGKIIRLPDVDPVIFGLFLKFIYRDSYPPNVDARTLTTHPHHRSLAAVPKPAIPGPTTTAVPRQPSPYASPNNINGNPQTTPPPTHMPILMPPPPPPQNLVPVDFIPPSVHAWLLAQRLGALSFMNHAISRIFSGIGVYFALTPSLMDHVWKETSPVPSTTTTTTTTTTTVLTPSPLLKLFLDVLVTYWSHSPSPNPNAVILRSLSVSLNFSAPLKEAWDRLFNEHTDLRNDFIYGLQGGVNKLMPVNAYFATSAPSTQSGMVKGGVAGSEFGKEEGRGGGRVEEDVDVKEEKTDETHVPTEEKQSKV